MVRHVIADVDQHGQASSGEAVAFLLVRLNFLHTRKSPMSSRLSLLMHCRSAVALPLKVDVPGLSGTLTVVFLLPLVRAEIA